MKKYIINENRYFDSVELMRISSHLRKHSGVSDAQLIMGSETNKQFLIDMGLDESNFKNATPMDLIIYLDLNEGQDEGEIIKLFEEYISSQQETGDSVYQPKSVSGAKKIYPGLNFTLISVPGQYAAWEAREALAGDMSVMIFSDNVTIEEELELKTTAQEKGLLIMGPDCGTAIINGIPLGFANKVNRGKIGLISASGTGLQAVTSEIHNSGEGISQAIGIGGRDLSEKISGISMKTAIHALWNDPETEVIVLISKPPAEKVTKEILEILSGSPKPVVVYFIHTQIDSPNPNIYFAKNLSHTAQIAVALARGERDKKTLEKYTGKKLSVNDIKYSGKYIRGLYTGGTLAEEALNELQDLGFKIYSNVHHDEKYQMKNPLQSIENTIIDLGDDFFTRGNPHPMISPESRIERLEQELKDPDCGIILMDIVLGNGSNEDMAGALLPTLEHVPDSKQVCIYVLGTDLDFQDKNLQISKLRGKNIHIFESHIEMIEFAGVLLTGGNK
ncbi:MAG: acyl-CoA synthetase FdrA [bacterium]|nr:acyl-CoA synthetase FdrA [bacterium]